MKIDDYAGYSWIKVKKHTDNPTLPIADRFRLLEQHHVEETTFLIDEVRRLAVIIDGYRTLLTKTNSEMYKPLSEISADSVGC